LQSARLGAKRKSAAAAGGDAKTHHLRRARRELLTNDASQTHGLYALALALAWRLQSYPMAERTILHAGLADLIRVNALELGGGE